MYSYAVSVWFAKSFIQQIFYFWHMHYKQKALQLLSTMHLKFLTFGNIEKRRIIYLPRAIGILFSILNMNHVATESSSNFDRWSQLNFFAYNNKFIAEHTNRF